MRGFACTDRHRGTHNERYGQRLFVVQPVLEAFRVAGELLRLRSVCTRPCRRCVRVAAGPFRRREEIETRSFATLSERKAGHMAMYQKTEDGDYDSPPLHLPPLPRQRVEAKKPSASTLPKESCKIGDGE